MWGDLPQLEEDDMLFNAREQAVFTKNDPGGHWTQLNEQKQEPPFHVEWCACDA